MVAWHGLYACLVAKYWFEQIARLPVEIDVASEFKHREPPIPDRQRRVVRQANPVRPPGYLAALRYCKGKTRSCRW
jgi:glucosamine--fructose-6-phosphate aminotransferase (isomerizing)